MAEPKPLASLTSGLLARKGGARPAMRRQPLGSGPIPSGAVVHDDLGWNDMGYDVDPVGQAQDDTSPAMDLKHLMAGSLSPAAAEPADSPDGADVWEAPAYPQDHGDEAVAGDDAGPVDAADLDAGDADDGDPHGAVLPFTGSPLPLDDAADVPPVVHQQSILATRVKRGGLDAPLGRASISPVDVEPVAPAPSGALTRSTVSPAPTARPRPAARKETGAKSKAAFTLRLDPARHLQLRLASALFNKSSQQILIDVLDDYLASLPQVQGLAHQFDDTDHHAAAPAANQYGNSK